MKRFNQLFSDIVSFENLILAAQQAQRGKRFQPSTANFNHHLESEIFQIQEELQNQTYQPGNFRTFTINDPKTRVISAAPYRDRNTPDNRNNNNGFRCVSRADSSPVKAVRI